MTSRRCPDCRATPVGAAVPHESSCPVASAALTLAIADNRWLALHPGRVARVRHLHPPEATDLETVLGVVVARADRPRWRVVVTGAGGVVRRSYVAGGRVVATVASVLPAPIRNTR